MKSDVNGPNVQRFSNPHEVLVSARETMETRSKAYGGFVPVVKGYGKTLDGLKIDKLPNDQKFLICLMVMKLQRWCNNPASDQNADSLLDLINYTACLHTIAYPKEGE